MIAGDFVFSGTLDCDQEMEILVTDDDYLLYINQQDAEKIVGHLQKVFKLKGVQDE